MFTFQGRRPHACAVAIAVWSCGVAACDQASAAPDADNVHFDRNGMLSHLANEVLLPLQAGLDSAAGALPASIDVYCDGLDPGGSGNTQSLAQAARSAWAATSDAWAGVEALLIGPAIMDNFALRDRINAWPALAPCDIDRDVVLHWTTPQSYDLSTKLGRQRGLSAIEFLLHWGSANHNCPAEPPGWSALAPDLPRARCRLAHTLAVDVAAAAQQLHTAWRPDGGNFASALATAGQGSAFPSAHEAVNQVSNSFFFVDRMVKDMKLGEAAGIVLSNACGAVNQPCLREVELSYSDRATFAIRGNLAALRRGISGTTTSGDGPGFDDFLIAVGQSGLASQLLSDLDQAIASASALPDSFLFALANNYASVVNTHAAVRTFTNHLKSQFLTLLALDIPDDVASDND